MPVGAIAGGVIGQVASPRVALAAASICFSLAALWVVVAPISTAAVIEGFEEAEVIAGTDGALLDQPPE
jgi:hypothetical protein